MKHSELRHQPRHVNPRIQVIREQSLRWDKIYILLAAVGHLVYIQSHIPSKEDLLI